MTKKIYIRADGSKKIGMGHLNRAAILAKHFKINFGIETILITKFDDSASLFMENKGIESILIDTNSSIKDEIKQIQALSQTLDSPELIIMDVLEYDIYPDYTNALRSFRCPLVAITDDSRKRVISADLVINGNPCQSLDYYEEFGGKYLIGPKYFIMDSEYASYSFTPPSFSMNKILICVGGSDHNNILFKIIDAVEKIKKYELIVVSSKSTGYDFELKRYIKSISCKTNLLIDTPSLKNLWGDCNIAVTAGGNTLFERIASRVPGCTICQLDRQNEIATKFEEMGVNVNIGLSTKLNRQKLENKLFEFVHNSENHLKQTINCGKVVDGNGLQRVGQAIYELLA